MFIPGGSCCLSCGGLRDSSYYPTVTCPRLEGATSLPSPSLHLPRSSIHSPLLLAPHPYHVFSMSTLLCPWLPCAQRLQEGAGRGQSHEHGGSVAASHTIHLSPLPGPWVLTSCPSAFRKRTHSPSSKDEQSIGLKDSLLAHSSDPVEMRRLNYQTPGRQFLQPACPVRPAGPWSLPRGILAIGPISCSSFLPFSLYRLLRCSD